MSSQDQEKLHDLSCLVHIEESQCSSGFSFSDFHQIWITSIEWSTQEATFKLSIASYDMCLSYIQSTEQDPILSFLQLLRTCWSTHLVWWFLLRILLNWWNLSRLKVSYLGSDQHLRLLHSNRRKDKVLWTNMRFHDHLKESHIHSNSHSTCKCCMLFQSSRHIKVQKDQALWVRGYLFSPLLSSTNDCLDVRIHLKDEESCIQHSKLHCKFIFQSAHM